jgi:hypothetical protein
MKLFFIILLFPILSNAIVIDDETGCSFSIEDCKRTIVKIKGKTMVKLECPCGKPVQYMSEKEYDEYLEYD